MRLVSGGSLEDIASALIRNLWESMEPDSWNPQVAVLNGAVTNVFLESECAWESTH